MSVENLAQYFSTVEDPRCAGKVEHRLVDILVIAVIACAESWDDIALYGDVSPNPRKFRRGSRERELFLES